jgi:hypothetical protein
VEQAEAEHEHRILPVYADEAVVAALVGEDDEIAEFRHRERERKGTE